jgi:hypothetical protein
VVEEQSDRHRRDRHKGEGEQAPRESLADRWGPDVDVRSGREHEHREADGTENGEWLAGRVDDAEARLAEHEPCDELADDHWNEPAFAEREQRPGKAGKHENRQLREHREIMPRNSSLVSIVAATKSYESWIGRQVSLVRSDLNFKHEQMALAPFPFLRSTFYRWVQSWEATCPDLASAPSVLAVGDLHTENFGTWRDTEGRLIWGINDFDEAFPMSYANDLVRLATSARFAIGAGALVLTPRAACNAILEGYSKTIEAGGKPFVLAEEHHVLRRDAQSELRDPVRFWTAMVDLPPARKPPAAAVSLLQRELNRVDDPRFVTRRAGLGSLGHPRVVAIAEHKGGWIAREAKELVGSGVAWAKGSGTSIPIHYPTIVRRAVRCADPFLEIRGRWILRRLAPDCSRIEFTVARLPAEQSDLLTAMGAEAANVHLGSGSRRIAAVSRDLASRSPDWLKVASRAMERSTTADYIAWQRSRRG